MNSGISRSQAEVEPSILLKAFPLKSPEEISQIKEEFTLAFGGDIARLGEERIVITPPGVKIWRGEKSDSGV